MKTDDVTFDLKQVQAITGDLQHLCRDLAQRLHQCHPDEAADFARALRARTQSGDTFVGSFETRIANELLNGRAGAVLGDD